MATEISVLGATIETSQIPKALNSALRHVRTFASQGRTALARLDKGARGVAGTFFNIKTAVATLASAAVFGKAISTAQKFEATIADLSAITGATGKDLEFLTEKAKEFGTQTTLSSSEAAEAFKLVASAKPDLLENGEALAEVTRQAILLAEASGSTLPQAAETLGSALNQFGADADQAGRFINVLAAGAQKGASEVADTAQALKQAGVVASSSGVSFEELNGAIQTLATVGVKGAEAGTALRNVMLILREQGIEGLNPKVVGLTGALRNLNDMNLEATKIQKIFGRENIAAGQALLDNVGKIKSLTTAVTGTNTAMEQAATKVNTLEGDMKTFGSATERAQIEFGTGLNPQLRLLTQLGTEVVRSLTLGMIPALDRTAEETTLLNESILNFAEGSGTVIGFVADAFNALGVVWKGLVVTWEFTKSSIVDGLKLISQVIDAPANAIDSMIESINDIRATLGTEPIALRVSADTTEIDKLVADTQSSYEAALKAFEEKSLAEVPSKIIKNALDGVLQKFKDKIAIAKGELAVGLEEQDLSGDSLTSSTKDNTAAMLRNAQAARDAAITASELKLGRMKQSAAQKENNKLTNEGTALTEALYTTEEKRVALIAKADLLLARKVITETTHTRALAAANGVTAKKLKMESEGKALTESLRTAEELRNAAIEEAKTLLDAGTISQDTYNRAVADAAKVLKSHNDAQERAAERLSKTEKATKKVEDAFKNTESAILEMTRTGEISLRSLLTAILNDILPQLKKGLGGITKGSGGSGSGGFLSGLFDAIGGLFGGGGGGGFRLPPIIPTTGVFGPFATGGDFTVPGGGSGTDSRVVSLLASPGEKVSVRNSAGGGGGPMIVVNNYSNESVSARQGSTLDGEQQLIIAVGSAMDTLESSGQRDRQVSANFGQRRKGVPR